MNFEGSTIENLPKVAENIKTLKLNNCSNIKSLPDCPKVEHIDIVACTIENLPKVAENIKTLKLNNCSNIKSLPDYPKVEHIDIVECAIENLPKLSENLRKLKITHCPKLKIIPSCSKLHFLDSIEIGVCREITVLPELPSNVLYANFADLTSLDNSNNTNRNILTKLEADQVNNNANPANVQDSIRRGAYVYWPSNMDRSQDAA